MHSKFRTVTIVAALLFFFALPISILMLGAGAAAISGIILIGSLILLQLPIYLLLERLAPKQTDLWKHDEASRDRLE